MLKGLKCFLGNESSKFLGQNQLAKKQKTDFLNKQIRAMTSINELFVKYRQTILKINPEFSHIVSIFGRLVEVEINNLTIEKHT